MRREKICSPDANQHSNIDFRTQTKVKKNSNVRAPLATLIVFIELISPRKENINSHSECAHMQTSRYAL